MFFLGDPDTCRSIPRSRACPKSNNGAASISYELRLHKTTQQAKFVPSSMPRRCSTSDQRDYAALFETPHEPNPGTKDAYQKTF